MAWPLYSKYTVVWYSIAIVAMVGSSSPAVVWYTQ